MTAVTTGRRAWRVAQTPPAVSASFIRVPPCTLPRGFASSGSMTWASVSSSSEAAMSSSGVADSRAWISGRQLIVQDLNCTAEHRIVAIGDGHRVWIDDLIRHDADLIEWLAVGRANLEDGHLQAGPVRQSEHLRGGAAAGGVRAENRCRGVFLHG